MSGKTKCVYDIFIKIGMYVLIEGFFFFGRKVSSCSPSMLASEMSAFSHSFEIIDEPFPVER